MTGHHALKLLLTSAAAVLVSACGGGGGGVSSAPPPPLTPTPTPTPAPTPTPPPSPPPPPFTPTAAALFADPLYNPNLAVQGGGWQHDYVPNSAVAQNIRQLDPVVVSYDASAGNYQVNFPVAGSGTLMQVGNLGHYPWDGGQLPGFQADPSSRNPAVSSGATLSVAPAGLPQSRYRYVSFIDLYASAPIASNLSTIGHGSFAVAQPTRVGEVPTTGTARFSGDLFGYFAGDAGATWVDGRAQFDFDFSSATLGGQLVVGMRCMMGCWYGDGVTYTFTDTRFTKGATTFSGNLSTSGAPRTGSFSGLFAGPGAAELAARYNLPFFNPEYNRWMDVSGAIGAKRD